MVLFLTAGAVKFLAANAPSFHDFAPGGVFAGMFIVFELLQHFIEVLPQYTLSTAVALTAFFASTVVLFFALYEKDAGRQSLLAGFGGSLLGFATGIPFGQLRLQTQDSNQERPAA